MQITASIRTNPSVAPTVAASLISAEVTRILRQLSMLDTNASPPAVVLGSAAE